MGKTRRFHHHSVILAVAFACFHSPAALGQGADDAGADGTIEEILVTAQRRIERAQDVPISISVVSAEDLEKAAVTSSEQALGMVPGLVFENRGPSQSNIFLRGVGTALTDGGTETDVAMYVDDVYIGSPLAFNFSLFDVERVEVLRGPQGTLYGKNALGGAIKFYSVKPDEQASGRLETSIGNYDYSQVRGTVSMPLAAGKVRTRFSGYREVRDGTFQNEYQAPGVSSDLDTLDSVALRGQVEIDLGEAWTLGVSADWARDEPVRAAQGKSELEEVLRTRVQRSPYTFTENRDLWGASVTATRTGDSFAFSSISAYRSMVGDYVAAGDLDNRAFSTDNNTDFDQVSQELRLNSVGVGPLQWTAGVYYYRDHAVYGIPYGLVGLAEPFGYPFGYEEQSDASVRTDAFAIFGDVTFALNERWSTSVGLRYGNERKTLGYSHFSNTSDEALQAFIDATYGPGSGLGAADFRFAPLGENNDSLRDDELSPRLVVSYKPGENLHFYSSIASGTKSGSFNTLFVASTSQFAFGPERAWSYELGMKSAWLDGRLGIDAAAYYTDWEDQQIRTLVPAGPAFVLLINNAGRSTVRGADFALAAEPLRGLRLSLGYSYVDATFDEYQGAPSGDLTGNRLPLVPEHSGTAIIDYTYRLSSELSFNIHADTSRRSSAFSDDVNDPQFRIRPRGFTNLSVGVDFGRWEFRLWSRNLFDEKYILRSAQGITGRSGAYSEPRTYGARVGITFD